MTTVRELRKEDIPELVDLHGRVFGTSKAFSTESLTHYFHDVFFASPWHDESLPSLLAIEGGRIAGFLGIVPRPMLFRGQPLRAAVCTQFMVDPLRRAGAAAIKLANAFVRGPQDLGLADGANDSARRMWVGYGGTTVLLYSLHWTRPLRPAAYLLSRLESRRLCRPLALAGRPWGAALDAVVARFDPDHFTRSDPDACDTEITPQAMISYMDSIMDGKAVHPVYDASSLTWLLEQAAQKKRHGDLRVRAVRDREQRILGWYIYYARSGGIAEVVQIAAEKESFERVLRRLLADAWRQGAIAVHGRLDPQFAHQLSSRHCWFRFEGPWTLVISRRGEIVSAFETGNAFLSRLDAEWWMRFAGG